MHEVKIKIKILPSNSPEAATVGSYMRVFLDLPIQCTKRQLWLQGFLAPSLIKINSILFSIKKQNCSKVKHANWNFYKVNTPVTSTQVEN